MITAYTDILFPVKVNKNMHKVKLTMLQLKSDPMLDQVKEFTEPDPVI